MTDATTPSLTNPNPKREDEHEAKARYYAKGEVVFKAPVEKRKADGTTSITIGFPVCKVSDYIGPEGAASLAEMLCVAEDANGAPPRPSEKVTLDYTNYRGERAIRTITPWGVEWGSTDWHPEPGWLLTCYDHDKAACRTYALSGIHSWNGVAVTASARPSPGDPVRAAISEAQLHAAMDAFYPGENWRVDLGCALESSLRDMKSALRAALSVSTPTGEGEGHLYEAARQLIQRWGNAPELPVEMELALSTFEDAWVAVRDGQPAALAHPQQGKERVRHVKRGTEYEVIGEAEAQVSEGMQIYGRPGAVRFISDGAFLTVFRCENTGKLWCRFTDEFRDGRFETIAPASVPVNSEAEREGWVLVPREPTLDMLDQAREAPIAKSILTMQDWVHGTDKEDCPGLGITWPDFPYDRHATVNEETAHILLTTWWKAMLAVAPSAPTPQQGLGERADG
jgi:hypothetical protein